MRAYLALRHSDLQIFVDQGSFASDKVFAPTSQYLDANVELDEEEIEFTLSIAAAEDALLLRATENSPGIVLALDLLDSQVDHALQEQVTLNSELKWDQVQCALLSWNHEEELTWYAVQEIIFHMPDWK